MQNLITEFYTVLEAVRDFLELGGPVLTLIAVLGLVMWMFMIERLLYLFISHRSALNAVLDSWNARSDRSSWYAHQVRDQLISLASMKLEKNLSIIKTMVVLCPLMGLLGTVTGMIEVFEVMAISGTGNARSLAAGVSKATVPTMAGMVVALSGVFLSSWLQKKASSYRDLLSEKMTFS
ncbi:MAG: MotA/TolQ/ExbB proton channel family protein [Gammaproteobacteria bacterium]|nr:MotA/TolQ/ExbB proton channel family protein [Gammaproteobacteria bacterium]